MDLPTPAGKPEGWTPLHLLANRPGKKRGELAQLLLDKRADPMRLTGRMATPLHSAAGTCNFEVARVLLEHPDIDVNAKNKDNKRRTRTTSRWPGSCCSTPTST